MYKTKENVEVADLRSWLDLQKDVKDAGGLFFMWHAYIDHKVYQTHAFCKKKKNQERSSCG